MKRPEKFALLLVAAGAIWMASLPARAQVTTGPVIVTKTVRTRQPKPSKTRYQVLRMMSTGIQVRSLVNQKEIHTFTYSDQIRAPMQTLLNKGGYRYGDKVVIQYMPGTEVALRIKGKPSKPH